MNILDFFDANWLTIVSLLILLLGIIIAVTTSKFEPVLNKLREGLELYRAYKSAESEGGTKLTEQEKDQLIDAMGQVFIEAAKLSKYQNFVNYLKRLFSRDAKEDS